MTGKVEGVFQSFQVSKKEKKKEKREACFFAFLSFVCMWVLRVFADEKDNPPVLLRLSEGERQMATGSRHFLN